MTKARFQTHNQIHKIARQGGGMFSLIRSEWNGNSQYELAEFNDRGQMVEQFIFATVGETKLTATERDLACAESVLSSLRYINDFPMAAEFEGVRASIDRMIARWYGK